MFHLFNGGAEATPGFTITYRESDKPEILRVSLFADADALWDLESSLHWQSPSFMSMPSKPMPGSEIYHSSVMDQAFGIPTASGPAIPIQTRRVMIPMRDNTTPNAPPATTQVPGDYEPFQNPLGRQGGERFDSKTKSSRPFTAIGNVFVNLETKAKSLIRSTISDIGSGETQQFIAAAKVSVSDQNIDGIRPVVSTLTLAAANPADPLISVSSIHSGENTRPLSQSRSMRTDQAIKAFQITSLIIIIVSLSTAIGVYLFRNPRRRADRAARWEECRRRQLYARAARKHKWNNWMSRFREATRFSGRSQSIAETWEEKQTLAVTNEEASLKRMRDELCSLRIVHEVVDGMVKAEEGRSAETSYKSRVRRVERRGSSVYGSSIESMVPPPYEERYEEYDMVADGFQYTPAGTDCTPDSSVIDTSPRTSIYMRDSDSEKE